MKKVLIFIFVAVIALASTGCASPLFTAKKDSSSDLKWLKKNHYELNLGSGGNMEKALTKAYEMAQSEDKVLLIGRCDKAKTVTSAIKCAEMDARSEYSKAINSNVVGVEKMSGGKDSDDKYNYQYISESNAHLDLQNFETVAVFKREARGRWSNSAIVFCVCNK